MAQNVKLTSGSVLNGNPITLEIQPAVITSTDDDGNTVYPSFHRIIAEVVCGMTDGDYETIKLSAPVETESNTTRVNIDIASALRTFRDSYEYTPQPVRFPVVKFRVVVYDEYMINGEVQQSAKNYFPGESETYSTLFGAFTDIERLNATGGTLGLTKLTRKPASMPQIVAVGETLAYTPAYTTEQKLESSQNLEAPLPKVETVAKEGLQTLGSQSVYALPASQAANRQLFRFINSLGVLESISVPKAYEKSFAATGNTYAVSRQETFSSFSRRTIVKRNNHETWSFTTDVLNEDWLYWYAHEFLMSEHIWLLVGSNWIPCTVAVDDDMKLYDRTSDSPFTISFSAQLDLNGSVY